jgi:putative transposase
VPESKVISLDERAKEEEKPFLEQLLREGARKLLQAAIENEVIDYIQLHKDRVDENGQRLVVRNGHLPEREVVSGAGPIPVRQPRVRHRDKGRFSSAILPKYMRRVPSVDALIPALYLKGISTGDMKLPRFDGHGNSNKKRESRWKRKGSTLSIKRSFGARQWKW